MRKYRAINLFVAVSALFVLLAAAPAYAAQTEVSRMSNSGLTASMGVTEFTQCGSTLLYIIAVDGRVKLDGRPEVSSAVTGVVDSKDFCTDSYWYGNFDVAIPDSAFQIDKKLNQATLHTTSTACGVVNWEEACFPVAIDLRWTGEGDTGRQKSREQQTTSHYKVMYSYDETSRSAIVTGSIVLPWRNLTENLTGSLSQTKSREMQVYKVE